ncbi:hypothetical protein [Arthrobacter sp. H16F315]|uniref:hypothetical protein n=1 Tax=Arthrobacter sp. H16F315 TaxID=2955314 RepID=UPI0020982DB7|nr:hypothetical protein [Arthrobacter sp. H16F315]MDD1477440.1 hypothetical protein [Arthrobacter sp. H16F315]
MSPVTSTEAQRTARQAGPFPGVGIGAGDVDGPGTGVPADAAPLSLLPAAAEREPPFSGWAPDPQEAKEATRDRAAATVIRRARRVGVRVRMAPSYDDAGQKTPVRR